MELKVFSRWVIRNWLFRRGRVGRSKARRVFNFLLGPQEVVEVAPGLKLALDLRKNIQESAFWFFEEVEPALQWTIKHLLPVGGVFIDVGANIGLMGLLAAYYRNARVMFVEPHPRLAQSLWENIALNAYAGSAIMHQLAASNIAGEVVLHGHPTNDGGHSIDPPSGATETFRVPARRLADLLNEEAMTFVDLLKVDVEGYDFEVLDGLGLMLDPCHVGMIFVEMEHRDVFNMKVWNILMERGYAPFGPIGALHIDQLHRLDRLARSGKAVTIFRPIIAPGQAINHLWCPRGGSVAELLLRIHRAAVNA